MSDTSIENDEKDILVALTASYADAIRGTDIKANILIVFLGVSITPVIAIVDRFHYASIYLLILIFPLACSILLLATIQSRSLRRGDDPFILGNKMTESLIRKAITGLTPNDFWLSRSLSLATILRHKRATFQPAIYLAILYIFSVLCILVFGIQK